MKPFRIAAILYGVMLFFTPSSMLIAAEEYPPTKGLQQSKVVFDFRDSNPESALVHSQLINMTYDKVSALGLKPEYAVIFMDASVTLLSQDRGAFNDQQKKMLIEMDEAITAMHKKGIRLEVCGLAVDYFKVTPNTITEKIARVENGWIASQLYQQNQFSLIPAF